MPRLTEMVIEKLIEFEQFMNISCRNSVRLGVLKNIDTKNMFEISKRYDTALNKLLTSVKEYNNDPSPYQKEFLSKNLEECLRNQKIIAKLIRQHLELAANEYESTSKNKAASTVASTDVRQNSRGKTPSAAKIATTKPLLPISGKGGRIRGSSGTIATTTPKNPKTPLISYDTRANNTSTDKTEERKYSAEPISDEDHKAWLIDTLRKCIESEMSITSFCRNLTTKIEVQNAILMAKKIPEISHQYDLTLKELFRNIKRYSEHPSTHTKEVLTNSMNQCETRRKTIKEFITSYLEAFPCPDGTKFDAKLRAEFEADLTTPQTTKVFPHDFEYMKTLVDYMKIMLISNAAKKT